MSLRVVGFFLQCLFVLAAAMYFDLGELEERCIIEEIPIDTLVTGKSFKKMIFSLWVHKLHICNKGSTNWKRFSSKLLFDDQEKLDW